MKVKEPRNRSSPDYPNQKQLRIQNKNESSRYNNWLERILYKSIYLHKDAKVSNLLNAALYYIPDAKSSLQIKIKTEAQILKQDKKYNKL